MEGQELPVGWVEVPIGDLCELRNGRAFKPAEWTDEGIPIVRIQNLNNWQAKFNHYQGEVDANHLLGGGELLFAWSGTPGTSFGAHIWAGGKAALNQHIFRVDFDEDSLQKGFFRYAINQKLNDLIDIAHGGVGLRHVTKGKFEQTEVFLPPLNEQRRLAAKLDTTLAAVDACRQRLDGVAAILKRFRQAVLSAATSGELTREWREERGGFSHWQEKGLAELGEFGRGRSRHRPRNDPRLYGGDYPFIQTGDVANAKGDWLAAHSQTYSNFGLAQSRIWPSSTLCITIAANIADTALLEYPACFPDSVVGFVADRAQVEPLFAKWMIDSVADKLESFAPATAQKNINLAILDQIVFSVPPLQEQTEIISRAQHLFTLADQLEARLTAARKVVDRLTPALLAKAFRGELVPQDPSDEPASELLARIRAARQAESGAGKSSGRGQRKAAANPAPSPVDAAPVTPDLLASLLRECGALSERALLAASELDPASFLVQFEQEVGSGNIRAVLEGGKQVLIVAGED
jgi:type I restriction enzyme S subunit